MLKLLLSRLATAIPSIVGVVIVTFMLTRLLPGDPAAYFAGLAASPQAIAEVRTKLGLDKTLPEQFVAYIGDLLHGNLGNSLSTGQPVVAEIATRLPASAELTLFALILAVAIAIPLGVLAAVKQGTWIDHLCRIVTTAGVSLPVFFTGLLFAYVFYYLLQWAPAPTRPARRVPLAAHRHHGLLPDRLGADRKSRDVLGRAAPARAAGDLDGDLLPGAARPHDPRLDAGGAGQRLHPHRAGQRPRAAHRRLHLRLPQRRAAGDHHARHGVLLPAGRQRAGRDGVRLAGHRPLMP